MTAQLNKLLTQKEDLCSEIMAGVPIEFDLLHGITFNFKVNLSGKLGPMKLFFFYPDNAFQKNMIVYTSHSNPEPDSTNNNGT